MEELKKKFLYLTNLLTSSFNQKNIVFLLLGLFLVGLGVLVYRIDLFSSRDTVEVLNSTTESQNNDQEIVVEISGAVEKSGVYKLKNGSRIDDLLISAGGISATADRDWIEKNINRAAKLIDGQKLYIYHSKELSAKNTSSIKLDQEILGSSNQNVSNLVNINVASQSELEKLVGIGPILAQKIIEQRPYSTLEELVNKKIIPQKTYEKIRFDISL